MRKTHPFLTLWESHRFKSDGNRFSTHFDRCVIRAGNEFESRMSHLFASLSSRNYDSGY